jgi:anti-sigma factor RsiW
MNRTDGDRKELADWLSDRDVWRRSCLTDAPEDEVARLLDLAAFADGLLEPDERDRVAALLAEDSAAADDVAAARALHAVSLSGGLERVIARACALAPDEIDSRVVAFVPPPPRRRIFHGLAQWGSLAAAIVLASWLGFAMGSDVSRTLRGPLPSSEANFLPELFDPGSVFLRDLGEVART